MHVRFIVNMHWMFTVSQSSQQLNHRINRIQTQTPTYSARALNERELKALSKTVSLKRANAESVLSDN